MGGRSYSVSGRFCDLFFGWGGLGVGSRQTVQCLHIIRCHERATQTGEWASTPAGGLPHAAGGLWREGRVRPTAATVPASRGRPRDRPCPGSGSPGGRGPRAGSNFQVSWAGRKRGFSNATPTPAVHLLRGRSVAGARPTSPQAPSA